MKLKSWILYSTLIIMAIVLAFVASGCTTHNPVPEKYVLMAPANTNVEPPCCPPKDVMFMIMTPNGPKPMLMKKGFLSNPNNVMPDHMMKELMKREKRKRGI